MKFNFMPIFAARSSNIVRTLKHMAAMSNSKWKVAPVPADDVEAGPQSVRLDAHGVDCLRSWVQKNRRILNNMGSRAWTPTERIL